MKSSCSRAVQASSSFQQVAENCVHAPVSGSKLPALLSASMPLTDTVKLSSLVVRFFGDGEQASLQASRMFAQRVGRGRQL